MTDLALLLRLQARVSAFLAELSRDRIVALIEGRADLSVVDTVPQRPEQKQPTTQPTPPSPSFDADAVATQLRACETLEQGAALLASLKPKAIDLKALAKAFNIAPATRKEDTAKKILNLAVGSRSKHAGLRQG
jgi:hypothetical protein